MALRLRLRPKLAQGMAELVQRLCEFEGPELSAAVEKVKSFGDARFVYMTVWTLIDNLKSNDPTKQLKSTVILQLFGPLAAESVAACLFTCDSKDQAFQLRLIEVLSRIGGAARGTVGMTLFSLLSNRIDKVIRDAAIAGLARLGPGCVDQATADELFRKMTNRPTDELVRKMSNRLKQDSAPPSTGVRRPRRRSAPQQAGQHVDLGDGADRTER